MVAAVQLAITLGASLGGLLFDQSGYQATFVASAVLLGASAVAALLASNAVTWRATGTSQSTCRAHKNDAGDAISHPSGI